MEIENSFIKQRTELQLQISHREVIIIIIKDERDGRIHQYFMQIKAPNSHRAQTMKSMECQTNITYSIGCMTTIDIVEWLVDRTSHIAHSYIQINHFDEVVGVNEK